MTAELGAMYGMQSRFTQEDVKSLWSHSVELEGDASIPVKMELNIDIDTSVKSNIEISDTWSRLNKNKKIYVTGAPIPEDSNGTDWEKLIIEVAMLVCFLCRLSFRLDHNFRIRFHST